MANNLIIQFIKRDFQLNSWIVLLNDSHNNQLPFPQIRGINTLKIYHKLLILAQILHQAQETLHYSYNNLPNSNNNNSNNSNGKNYKHNQATQHLLKVPTNIPFNLLPTLTLLFKLQIASLQQIQVWLILYELLHKREILQSIIKSILKMILELLNKIQLTQN